MSHVQKKRLIFVVSNKVDRLVRFTVGQVLALVAGFQRRDLSLSISRIGIEIVRRLAEVTTADIEIESLLVGIPIVGAEVPFSDVA